jgi:hypothetical protein
MPLRGIKLKFNGSFFDNFFGLLDMAFFGHQDMAQRAQQE